MMNIKKMMNNQNIFSATTYGYNGLNYLFSMLNTNVIFMSNSLDTNIEFYKILGHELGHSYESKLYLNSGRLREYNKTFNSPFYEVVSSFMEYAYINYLIENNIYKDEAKILLHDYINELLINSVFSSVICKIPSIEENIDPYMNIDIKSFDDYLENIRTKYNMYSIPKINRISLSDPFIYGFGQLFSIYLYDNYEKDPNNFKREFNKSLIDYSTSEDMSSFVGVGINCNELEKAEPLKRVLTKIS